jgi:hypothetical protein
MNELIFYLIFISYETREKEKWMGLLFVKQDQRRRWLLLNKQQAA